jgi:hypothetical protein
MGRMVGLTVAYLAIFVAETSFHGDLAAVRRTSPEGSGGQRWLACELERVSDLGHLIDLSRKGTSLGRS